ncbi:hypothetical protein E2562_038051 [Oryza meyeriana var. granulata]|uniref:Uncharacterized protein n=1 Tax=Oryza meyeriana var. granulata TaxID=110450 RepID=A0A6G1EU34_9ORYZ|nr:hypothetical protein E2562_038051 [Oryza meyeriana var. granulata]
MGVIFSLECMIQWPIFIRFHPTSQLFSPAAHRPAAHPHSPRNPSLSPKPNPRRLAVAPSIRRRSLVASTSSPPHLAGIPLRPRLLPGGILCHRPASHPLPRCTSLPQIAGPDRAPVQRSSRRPRTHPTCRPRSGLPTAADLGPIPALPIPLRLLAVTRDHLPQTVRYTQAAIKYHRH